MRRPSRPAVQRMPAAAALSAHCQAPWGCAGADALPRAERRPFAGARSALGAARCSKPQRTAHAEPAQAWCNVLHPGGLRSAAVKHCSCRFPAAQRRHAAGLFIRAQPTGEMAWSRVRQGPIGRIIKLSPGPGNRPETSLTRAATGACFRSAASSFSSNPTASAGLLCVVQTRKRSPMLPSPGHVCNAYRARR